jgi:hypothetical protein
VAAGAVGVAEAVVEAVGVGVAAAAVPVAAVDVELDVTIWGTAAPTAWLKRENILPNGSVVSGSPGVVDRPIGLKAIPADEEPVVFGSKTRGGLVRNGSMATVVCDVILIRPSHSHFVRRFQVDENKYTVTSNRDKLLPLRQISASPTKGRKMACNQGLF